jgi:heme exporter protein D
MQDFLAMGGYAWYVWPAYAVFFVVLLADYLAPVVQRRRILRELRGRIARQRARQTGTRHRGPGAGQEQQQEPLRNGNAADGDVSRD